MGKGERVMLDDPPDCRGRSILEIIWEQLDSTIERMMNGGEAADGRDPGRAEGYAYAIAVIQNPYAPSIPAVRNQAMERYHAKHDEPETDEDEEEGDDE